MTIRNRQDVGILIPSLVDDLSISVFAFRVYAHLIRLSGQGRSESICEMSKSCGIGQAEVTLSLSELSNWGLIELKGMNSITILPITEVTL